MFFGSKCEKLVQERMKKFFFQLEKLVFRVSTRNFLPINFLFWVRAGDWLGRSISNFHYLEESSVLLHVFGKVSSPCCSVCPLSQVPQKAHVKLKNIKFYIAFDIYDLGSRN